jgi:hypothetical protein
MRSAGRGFLMEGGESGDDPRVGEAHKVREREGSLVRRHAIDERTLIRDLGQMEGGILSMPVLR